ncbi:MAG: hypothetical protein K6T17_04210 [Fimbriimonadales bacterium]|nr:hypothetical protein [Fimbriimonadales bacterium]
MELEVLRILEELRHEIERPRQFLGLTFGLNREKCALLIRRILATLPDDLKRAEQIVHEVERLTASAKHEAQLTLDRAATDAQRTLEVAKQEAQKILQSAQAERERLVSEHEVLKIAKREAEETRKEAETHATRLKQSADEYARDVLIRLESILNKVMGTIEKGKAELERSLPSERKQEK